MARVWPAVLLSILSLGPCAGLAQQTAYQDRLRLEGEVARLADPLAGPRLGAEVGAVMAGVDLTWSPAKPFADRTQTFVADGSAVVELVDIRLLLAQIAIQTGARDHVALVRAQGDRSHQVILLRGGFASVGDLPSLAQGTPAEGFVAAGPRGLVLTRPLAIWSDAGLQVARGDHLILDRPSGAFVANLGRLDVIGGKISGTAGSNTAEPAFRPFVLSAGQGSLSARDAIFQALGFGDVAVFGGVAVANNGLVAARMPSVLQDSTLDDVRSVGLIGTAGAVVSGNWITRSSGTALLVADSRDTALVANRFSTLTGAQAIRITSGSDIVRVEGNFLTGGARIGVLIDGDSRNVQVAGNLVSGQSASGISIAGAACVRLDGNLVAANGGAGLNIRQADAVEVGGNALLLNRGSGVLVRDQAQSAAVTVTANTFIGNRDGLRGATPGGVVLHENRLERQLPRPFAGDFARLTADWLQGRAAPASMRPMAVAMPDFCMMPGEG